jgi:hypothetical protein
LFWKYNKATSNIFLDPSLKSLDSNEEKYYNIILSPSLYWVKKAQLPLKYAHEVKKLAPSLFEDILPAGNYSYVVYKEQDYFLLFAYEDKQIISLLQEKNIALGAIKSIHFAQSMLETHEGVYGIDEERVITSQERIVLLLPREWFDDIQTLDIASLKPSKKEIKLQQFNHIISAKTLYSITAILFAFFLLLAGEYFLLKKQNNHIETQKDALFASYNLKPTMMQNKAILAKYKKIDTRQKELRQYIYLILKTPLAKGQKITNLSYNNSMIKIDFSGIDQERALPLINKLKKEKIPYKTRTNKNTFVVEIKL